MSFYTLSISDPSIVESVWTQIDNRLRQTFPGNPSTAINSSFTGTTTIGSAVITTSNTTGLYVGQVLSGLGIPTGSVINSIVPNTSVTMNNNATLSETAETITASLAALACAIPGGWCYDTTHNQLYLCTATDGSGNPSGTTWSLQDYTISSASTTAAGVVQLASNFNGSNGVLALTGASINSVMALAGNNSNITQLSGLTTPLSTAQGGTGATSFLAALLANLPSFAGNAGKVLGTDGTNIILANNAGYSNVITPTTGSQLNVGQLVVLSTDSLTHTLPANPGDNSWVQFTVRNVSNVIIQTSDSSKIENSTNSFQIDKPNAGGFRLVYSLSNTNWTFVGG